MHFLFEKSDALNTPIECFVFNANNESFPVRPHWHYFYEIIYMLEGTAQINCNESSYFLSEGDMIILPSKSVHSIFAAEKGALEYAVLKFDINKFNASSAYAPKIRSIFSQAESVGMNIYFPQETAEKMGCGEYFSNCLGEIEGRRYGYDLMLKTEIYGLLMSIVREWLSCGLVIDSSLLASEKVFDVDTITEYIDQSMNENPRVSEIAAKCGMSYSCFAKKFREVYGMSCKEYIERMRIFKAEEFLLFTDHDLNFISQETGFSDCSHMIKSFKQLRGITPKQFRMSGRKTVDKQY